MNPRHVQAVVDALPADQEPVGERDLIDRLVRSTGLTREHAHEAILSAHAHERIRWVAYRGWARGGRPT